MKSVRFFPSTTKRKSSRYLLIDIRWESFRLFPMFVNRIVLKRINLNDFSSSFPFRSFYSLTRANEREKKINSIICFSLDNKTKPNRIESNSVSSRKIEQKKNHRGKSLFFEREKRKMREEKKKKRKKPREKEKRKIVLRNDEEIFSPFVLPSMRGDKAQ